MSPARRRFAPRWDRRGRPRPPEVLVYNAGAFQMGGILEIRADDFERCWKANCFGALVAAQAVLPAMLDAGRG